MSTIATKPIHTQTTSLPEPVSDARTRWWQSTWALACLGSLLLWMALPPLAWGWLGWVAPIPWLILARRDELTGGRPYLKIYFAGVLFWLLTIHWLRLPLPAVYLGWLALSLYLGVYLPVFVGLSRVAVHRLRWPLWLAAPVVWTGLELAQGHLLTGFLMGNLGHTQVRFTRLIQIADTIGAYGVSFLLMLTASCAVSIVFKQRGCYLSKQDAIGTAVLGVALGVTFTHGSLSQIEHDQYHESGVIGPTVALIQGNTLPTWKLEDDRQERIMNDQLRLSKQAVEDANAAGKTLDVIIWPETMFRYGLVEQDGVYGQPSDAKHTLYSTAYMLDAPLLVGIDRYVIHKVNADGTPVFDAYNSAALVSRSGELLETYDKSHLVMFGEYVPFAKWIPWLDTISPITGSATHGAGPVAFDLDGIRYVPSICYETVIPHVIRRQVRELSAYGKQPDVLVNITNDAWYWGSSELDQHLACGVFRAIETRTPLVIAANGGLSAVIDGSGKILYQSPRLAEDVIVATVPLDPRTSSYVATGDWFAGTCLMVCVVLAVVGLRARRSSSR